VQESEPIPPVANTKVPEVAQKSLLKICNVLSCNYRRPFRTESDLKYVCSKLQCRLLIECRRHTAKHARSFACTELACTVKPFGDNAGLLRHRREVHGKQGHGKPSQEYRCPNSTCKRHLRGFARRSNLVEHGRRIHETFVKDDLENSTHRQPNTPGRIVEVESAIDNAMTGSQVIIPDQRQIESENNAATLRGLQNRLDEIRKQKDEAMQRFDGDIRALGDALDVLHG